MMIDDGPMAQGVREVEPTQANSMVTGMWTRRECRSGRQSGGMRMGRAPAAGKDAIAIEYHLCSGLIELCEWSSMKRGGTYARLEVDPTILKRR